MLKTSLLSLLILLPAWVQAAPAAKLLPHWQAHAAESRVALDHSPWDQVLKRYLDTRHQPHRFDYAAVTPTDRQALRAYLDNLQAVRPHMLNRREQMAYWINLYNAATVDLILQHWPVSSITRIKSGLFSFGPWDKNILQVDDQNLSLNDIEHGILRPIFRDPRIHYAVNCASIGCPNLAARAYRADQLDSMLDAAARAFVNHARGVTIQDGKLQVSSIYHWFAEDFGSSDAAVLEHLRQYADAELKSRLMRLNKIHDHHYDWAINAP